MSNGHNDDDVSLTERAYQSISEAIARRDLKPGEPLTQDRLARWLSISRTPVREALRRLEQDGVIQTVAGRGLIVSELTSSDVAEMLEMLQTLEARAAGLAAQRRTHEQAQRLVAISQELVAAAQSRDFETWYRADRPFHEIWLAASGNRYLGQAVRDVRRRLQRVTYNIAIEPAFMLAGSYEHVAIAEAIFNADAARAAALAGAHVESITTRAMRLIRDYIIPVRGERF